MADGNSLPGYFSSDLCRAAAKHQVRVSWPMPRVRVLIRSTKTVSRKQALETGADIRVERLHSVNGDGYRTPRMARNGAVCATSRNSEREKAPSDPPNAVDNDRLVLRVPWKKTPM